MNTSTPARPEARKPHTKKCAWCDCGYGYDGDPCDPATSVYPCDMCGATGVREVEAPLKLAA